MPYDSIVVEKRDLQELIQIGADASEHDLDLGLIEHGELGTHQIRALDRATTDDCRLSRDTGDKDLIWNHKKACTAFVTQLAEGATKYRVCLDDIRDDINSEGSSAPPKNRGDEQMHKLFDRATELQRVNMRYDFKEADNPGTHASHDKKVTWKDV